MTLRDVLRKLNVEFREHGESGQVSAGWLGLACPHCAPGSGKFKCGINLKHFAVSCYVCGRHRLGETLAKSSGIALNDVLALLGGLTGETQSWDDWRGQKPHGTLKLPDDTGELLPAHRRYLAKRGFDPDECAALWGVRGVGPDGGKHRWRILFPIMRGSKTVSYQCRAVGPDVQPRYLAADPENEDLPLKHCLGGEQHARHSVVVVEGFFQAMRVGPGALATLGVGYTETQLLRLSRYPSRTICYDSEPAAQRRARQLADALSVFPGDTRVAVLSGAQPDTSPPDELAELRERFLS